MSYLQARSGIARSGVTYCGLSGAAVTFYLNGVDVTSKVVDFTLQMQPDGVPDTCHFSLRGVIPATGNDVAILYTTPNDYLFTGTLLEVEVVTLANLSSMVLFQCTATGYEWLLDRYDRVLWNYSNMGINTILADILARWTDGGFRVGYCPSSLGNIDIAFNFDTVSAAIKKLAAAASPAATYNIRDGKVVNLYATYPQAALPTLTNQKIIIGSRHSRFNLTQARTRTKEIGAGSTVTAVVGVGATMIPVADVTPFSIGGGQAVCGISVITYTGISGYTLTGCSGLVTDLPANSAINLLADYTDTGAETALATRLGGGLSGQALNIVTDNKAGAKAASARAQSDVTLLGTEMVELQWRYLQPERQLRPGLPIVVNFSNPTVSTTLLIQTVTVKGRGPVGGGSFQVWQDVVAAGFKRWFTDAMRQINQL